MERQKFTRMMDRSERIYLQGRGGGEKQGQRGRTCGVSINGRLMSWTENSSGRVGVISLILPSVMCVSNKSNYRPLLLFQRLFFSC